MTQSLFILGLISLFLSFLNLVAHRKQEPEPEPVPLRDVRPCHVTIWMLDNNKCEFDGPGADMADVLVMIKNQTDPFLMNTPDGRLLINPRHVVQCHLAVIKPPVEEPAK